MKLFKLALASAFFFTFSVDSSAQENREIQRVLSKAETKELEKEVKKTMKELNGWTVKPGTLSMETQVRRSCYTLLFETDKWLTANSSSIGTVYDAARLQAMTLAKNEIASQMETMITNVVDAKVANRELGQGVAESVTDIALRSKEATIDKKIKRPRILIECYRNLPNGNVEVLIRLAVGASSINELAEQIVNEAMKEVQ